MARKNDPASVGYEQAVTELEEILDAIITRELRDETREISPLAPAHDALIIDTSDMHMNKVIEVMHQEIQRRGMQ